MANKIQIRRDTAANWNRINPVLSDGEPGLEIDTDKVKYGNGTSTWTALSYGIGDQLKSGNAVVSLSSTGTVSIPSILPVTFVAYMDAAHFVGTPSPLDLTDLPWYYTITFAVNAAGVVETQIDGDIVWPGNPNYPANSPFRFTQADHGIPGFVLTIILNQVSAGEAGWAANLSASPPPSYPSTISSPNPIKISAGNKNIILGTDGSLTFPDNSVQTTAYTGGGGGGGYATTSTLVNNGHVLRLDPSGDLHLPGSLWNLAESAGIIFSIDGTNTTGRISIDSQGNMTQEVSNTYKLQWSGNDRLVTGSQDSTLSAGANINLVSNTNSSSNTWTFHNSGILSLPNAIDFGQNTSTLEPPQSGGSSDKIRLWDFQNTNPSGVNYAIGAEGDHMWFATDVTTNAGGFKFYSTTTQVFKIGGDGSLNFTDGSVINNGQWSNSNSGISLLTHDTDFNVYGQVSSSVSGQAYIYSGNDAGTRNLTVKTDSLNNVITVVNNSSTWTFGSDGVLTLPSTVGDIKRDGVSVLGGGGGFATTSSLVNGSETVALNSNGNLSFPNTNIQFGGSGNGQAWGGTVANAVTYAGFLDSTSETSLLTFSSSGGPGMSLQTDGSIFAGDGLGSAPYGQDATSTGWIIAQNGVGTPNVTFADSSTQTTAWLGSTNILSATATGYYSSIALDPYLNINLNQNGVEVGYLGFDSGNDFYISDQVAGGNILLQTTTGANQLTWTFGSDGELTAPGDIVINNGNTLRLTVASYGASLVANGSTYSFGSGGITFPSGNTQLIATQDFKIAVSNGIPTGVANWNGQGGWNQVYYTNLATTGGSGTGLTVDVAANGGGYINISAITINTPGTGYKNGDVITINNENNLPGTFTVVVAVNNWTFSNTGADGGLVFPDSSTQYTAWLGTGSYDISSFGNNGSFVLPYIQLSGTPTIPTDTNQLANSAGFITSTASLVNGSYSATLDNSGNLTVPSTLLTPTPAQPSYGLGVNGSPLTISAGFGSAASAGSSFNSGNGGNLSISAGSAAAATQGNVSWGALGGNVSISAGYSSGPYLGGSITLTAGTGTGGSGNITLSTGGKNWAFANNGHITFPDSTVQTTAWTGVGYLTTASYASIGYDLIPTNNLTNNLGSPTKQWRSLYVGTNTIYIGGFSVSVTPSGVLNVGGNIVATVSSSTGAVPLASLASTASYATTATQLTNLKVTANPNYPLGSTGDAPGQLAFDNRYIYYSTGTYVAQTATWYQTVSTNGVQTVSLNYNLTPNNPYPQNGWSVSIPSLGYTGSISGVTNLGGGNIQISYNPTPSGTITLGSTAILLTNPNPVPVWTRTPWNAITTSTGGVGGVTSIIAGTGTYINTSTGAVTIWTTASGGSVSLTNLSTDITFSAVGVGAPTFTTLSTGTKISYYAQETANSVDYATGIEAGALWNSIPQAASNYAFKWYGGTSTVASLNGLGTLTATKFIGDGSSLTNITVTQQANIVGVQPNVTLQAGSYSYLFDNTGVFTMPYNGDIVMTGTNANLTVGGVVTATNLYVGVWPVSTSSFNTSTLVAYAVTASNIVGGIGVSSIIAGTGTAINTSTGVVTIWVTATGSSGFASTSSIVNGTWTVAVTTSGVLQLAGTTIQSLAFTGGNISWSTANQTDFQGQIKVGGTGRILSPGGAASITLNNNGFTTPQIGVTTLNVTGISGTTGSTNGDLTVAGGVGIAGGMYIGGVITATNIYLNGYTVSTSSFNTSTLVAQAVTASNVVGGYVSSIVAGTGTYISGSTGSVTVWITTASTFSTGTLVSTAVTATNLAGGANGSIPYQTAAGQTAYIAIGTAGYILSSNGTTATWISTTTLATSQALSAGTYTVGVNSSNGTFTVPGTIASNTSTGSVSIVASFSATSISTWTFSTNGGLTFPDNSVQYTAYTAGIVSAGALSNVTLVAVTSTYTFDNLGNFTLPYNGNIVMTGTNANISLGGNITMPNRPAFRVYGAGTTQNLGTTVNTNGILNGNNFAVDYQQGTALNTSTGVFTAPVAGLYSIHLVARVYSNTAPSAQAVVIKNYSTTSSNMVMWETAANSTVNHFGVSTIAKLAVGDTLVLKVTIGSINFDANDSWAVAYIG